MVHNYRYSHARRGFRTLVLHCPEQPMIVRESTPTSDCSICICDPYPFSPLIPQSPTSPDFSFLSCTHASFPDLSIELNASYLRSSTPDQVSQSQEKSTSLEDISTPPGQLQNKRVPLTPVTPPVPLFCHKLVGDNLVTRVLPRNMRADHQSQSLHYFNMYAVQDRTDLSHLSNESRVIDSDDIDLGKLLPLAEDYDAL